MSDLVISKMIETGNQIRIINIPNQTQSYVAKDITNILGYSESGSSQAVKTHCENPKRFCDISSSIPTIELNKINDLGISQTTLLIQRPDVHRLIVAAKRTKEEAAVFEKWIFDEVLEEVMDNGSYSLTNQNQNLQVLYQQNLEVQSRMLAVLERMENRFDRMETRFEKMEERYDSLLTCSMDMNTNMTDAISNFNQVLSITKFQTAMSTAFAIEDDIPLDKFTDISRDMAVLGIRANFNDINLRIYLNKSVSEKERIFKSNGEPYERFIAGGHYRVVSGQTTQVYITRKGAEYLYNFLKMKKIFE